VYPISFKHLFDLQHASHHVNNCVLLFLFATNFLLEMYNWRWIPHCSKKLV